MAASSATSPIIHAVAARLDTQQVARLRAIAGVRLFEDRQVAARGSLLSGLTQTLSKTTNALNQTLATNPLVSTVTTTALPLVTSVTGISLPAPTARSSQRRANPTHTGREGRAAYSYL